MRNYTLENYENKLVHQVIHLDQGAYYCPEYMATNAMRDYPSRKLQLGWSIMKDYIKPTEFTSNLLFQSILSRQGERWQCFGESSEDLTDSMILLREMMIKKGFSKEIITEFKDTLKNNDGHVITASKDAFDEWQKNMPVDEKSTTYLLLDDATFSYTYKDSKTLGDYFKKNKISFYPEIKPTFIGFEYFAYGLIDEGISYMDKFIKELKDKNIKTIMTFSGQAEYMFKTYLQKLPVDQPFEVLNVLDDLEELKVDKPSFIYGGSFNLRYLFKSEKLNNLVKNTKEERIKNSPELSPLLKGDKRVNILMHWQKPIGAEYHLIGFDKEILAKIEEKAIEDINKSNAKQVIVFEPYAYKILKNKMKDTEIIYYFALL